MGKIVATLAVVAVAAAITYFAPSLGLTVLHAFGSSAVAGSLAATAASAVVAVGLSVAASFAFQLLAPKPGTVRPGSQASSTIVQTWGSAGPATWPALPIDHLEPIRGGWNDPGLLPGQRFALVKTRGTCMRPFIRDTWAIIDRDAVMRCGDYVLFGIDDMAGFLGRSAWRVSGLGKRFVGFDPVRKVMAYETTNGPARMESGIERVTWAYRVRATAPTFLKALRLYLEVRSNPKAFNQHLAG
jgi:hypothetical protein